MAKNNKGGLGRGLDSLIGGYEALTGGTRPVRERSAASEVAPQVTHDEPRRTADREVIREENLTREDRAVLEREKKGYSSSAKAYDYRDEDDGVTIKGIVERPAHSAAPSPQTMVEPAIQFEEPEPEPEPQPAPAAREAADGEGAARAMDEVDIAKIFPNPDQPRSFFNQEALEELAASIQKDGLLQPILVREVDGRYEIIAGERRWQACQLAGLTKVPIRIKEADDMKVLELALIENLQRSDLNPIEEAYGYRRMMQNGGRTQSEVAAAVSKGRSTIANALRLLDLPEDAQQLLYEEKITAGHARAILSIPSEEGRQKLTDKLRTEKMSVREAEALARLIVGREQAADKPRKPPAPPLYKKAAKSLGKAFQTKVRIRSANGKNKIEIEFKDEDDLRRIFDMMNNPE